MRLDFVRPLIKYLPEVRLPKKHIVFKEKLIWSSAVLVLFFIMGVITPVGVSRADFPNFQLMQIIFASQIGSIISTGIGPIVTASIILQLLVGAKMIDLDMTKAEDKALFQGSQKILAILISFFEATAIVLGFHLGQHLVGAEWGILNPMVQFIIVQIAVGSILLMYMDEIVSKWGIGSGIGLFIAGGVSRRVMTASLNFLPAGEAYSFGENFAGAIPNAIHKLFIESSIGFFEAFSMLWPVLGVIIIFLIVVYFESMRLEIPLSYGGIRGVGGRYPLKFFYVSNIPVILAAALLMNVNMWTRMANIDIDRDMNAVEKVIFLISKNITLGDLHGILSPHRIIEELWKGGVLDLYNKLSDIILLKANPIPTLYDLGFNPIVHLLSYSLVFIGLCVLFGKFWVETTGLGAEQVAEQIQQGGMQIPGFRRDKRIIERVLNRYIPQITIVSSVAVGLLALGADLMGAFGSGTGILLTVGILYRLYEEIQREQMAELHPVIRRFMGKG